VGGLSKETWAARPPLWLCLFLHSRSPTYVGVGMWSSGLQRSTHMHQKACAFQATCMSTRVRFMPQEAFQRPSQHTIRALRPRECLVKLRRQRRRVRQSQHCTPADACARQGGARVLGGGANRLSRERTEDGHLRPHSERPSSKDRAMRTAWLRTARNSSLSTLMLSDEPLHLEQPRPAVRLAHTLNRQPIRTLICMRACVSACVQGGAP